ncbi:MAG: hypothetical protein NVS2B2_24350 [Ktedonobacteraceae bacterium]
MIYGIGLCLDIESGNAPRNLPDDQTVPAEMAVVGRNPCHTRKTGKLHVFPLPADKERKARGIHEDSQDVPTVHSSVCHRSKYDIL